MDSYRGTLVQHERSHGDATGACDYFSDDDIGPEAPPASVGQDERRMQVRAYNHWTSLLGARDLPRIEDLTLGSMPEFAGNAVVLDFSGGTEDPTVAMLGERLAEECGAANTVNRLSDVPERSLLSRITEQYTEVLANEAPIAFEAEFVNGRDKTVVYRGMLLPFSGNGAKIQNIMGVINWKELADPTMTAELLQELDHAAAAAHWPATTPLGEWADGPAAGEPAANADILAAGLAGGELVDGPHDTHQTNRATREKLAEQLRALPSTAWADIAQHGSEFAVMLVRRMPDGQLHLIKEASQDSGLIEQAARHILH